jgi:uncharacterized phage protein (TIGR02218 family)
VRQIGPELASHLATGATTLCWCWRLERRDGLVFGFTDHDHDVMFDGETYEALAGLTASEVSESLGLSVNNLEISGGVTSDRLTENDLAAGAYDDAEVLLYLVNWKTPEERLLMRTGSLGEVKRSGQAFTVEMRGLAHYLQQPKGRLYQYACDADLGDSRCRIDLTDPAYKATGSVDAVRDDKRFRVSGLSLFESDFFSRGLLSFSSGALDAQSREVRRHWVEDEGHWIELWQSVGDGLSVGDDFTITAGCDKSPKTCRLKFSNMINFRGFPNMPGTEYVLKIASRRRSG